MAEWSKAHAWKVCVPHKGTKGSNPFLSAESSQNALYRVNAKNEAIRKVIYPDCFVFRIDAIYLIFQFLIDYLSVINPISETIFCPSSESTKLMNGLTATSCFAS